MLSQLTEETAHVWGYKVGKVLEIMLENVLIPYGAVSMALGMIWAWINGGKKLMIWYLITLFKFSILVSILFLIAQYFVNNLKY